MWSFEKLFGESFSSGDERKWLAQNEKENVYRKVAKVSEVSAKRNLHTLKNL